MIFTHVLFTLFVRSELQALVSFMGGNPSDSPYVSFTFAKNLQPTVNAANLSGQDVHEHFVWCNHTYRESRAHGHSCFNFAD